MTSTLASEGELLKRQRHHTHLFHKFHQTLGALADFQQLTSIPAVQGRAVHYERLSQKSGQLTTIEHILIQSEEVNVKAHRNRYGGDFDYFHPVTDDYLENVTDIKILATQGPLKFHLRGSHLRHVNFYPQLSFTAADQRVWNSRSTLVTTWSIALGLSFHLMHVATLLYQLPSDHSHLIFITVATTLATGLLLLESNRFRQTLHYAAAHQLVNIAMQSNIYQVTSRPRLVSGLILTCVLVALLTLSLFLPATSAAYVTIPATLILLLTCNDVLHRKAEIEGQRLAHRVMAPLISTTSVPNALPSSVQGEDRLRATQMLTQLKELSENNHIDPYLRWRSFTAFHTDWPESLRLIQHLPSDQQPAELLHHLSLLVNISQNQDTTSGDELQAHRRYLEDLAQEHPHA